MDANLAQLLVRNPRETYIPLETVISPRAPETSRPKKPSSVPSCLARISRVVSRPFTKVSRPRWLPSLPAWMRFSGWRATIFAGTGVALVALCINVVVLLWGRGKPIDPNSGNPKLFEGSCTQMQTTFTWTHLAINVLSTMLLGSSNLAMQSLSAPTREEVDETHGKGDYLDIGISGLRNWKAMQLWRRILWILLAASSVPLHLFYNSIIFSTSIANEYAAAIVTESFLERKPFSLNSTYLVKATPNTWIDAVHARTNSSAQYSGPNPEGTTLVGEYLSGIQNNLSSLSRLDPKDCAGVYSKNFVSDWSNVLLVTSLDDPINSGSVIKWHSHYPIGERGAAQYPPTWMCDTWVDTSHTPYTFPNCDPSGFTSGSSEWTFDYCASGGCDPDVAWPSTTVQYCLAQETTSTCTIQMSVPIVILIIAFNGVKAVCFILAIRKRSFDPLITLGDALASFLDRPDRYTLGLGAISADEVRSRLEDQRQKRRSPITQRSRYQHINGRPGRRGSDMDDSDNDRHLVFNREVLPEVRGRRRWRFGASASRWVLSYLFCLLIWISGFVLIIKGYVEIPSYYRDSFATLQASGFSAPSANSLVPWTESVSIFGSVLVANIPQLIVSFAYVFLNNLLTCMLLSREFTQFAIRRSGLRVTHPASGSEQRSTFWLSLPYRFSLPLLVGSAVLHWALSQTLFFAQVTVRDPAGRVDLDRSVSCVGWSALALVILLIVSGVIMIVPILIGFLRYPSGVPVVESCSLAMAAACHPLLRQRDRNVDDQDDPITERHGNTESESALKYGVIGTDTEGNKRAGLSSRSVKPLVVGDDYL